MNFEFIEKKTDGREYLLPSPLNTDFSFAAFTSKVGGFSHGKIEGLNLGFRVGDEKENVYKNYRAVASDLGFDLDKAVLARQTHTDNIRIVTEDDLGKGITKESDITDTDGLITDIKGATLIIFAADCMPVLFLDPKKKVVAAAHSGWRGTVKEIAAKTVRLMKSEFGSEPEDILAAVGPSIGKCCFEVDEDAAFCFDKRYRIPKSGGKYHVDLWSAVRDMLEREGVPPQNIGVSGVCTICHSDKYYSYRAHKDHAGRCAGTIGIRR